jgi:hypothetical protein
MKFEGLTWRVQLMRVNTNVLDPVFVLRRSSQQEIRVVLEFGGLTPLSFCVRFAFCAIAVGGAERKKGTAKAASSHRTPKTSVPKTASFAPSSMKLVALPHHSQRRDPSQQNRKTILCGH